MFQYDEEEEDMFLCVNCDAEYTITRYDDEQEPEAEFCPFCGYQHIEEDDEDDEDLEDEGTLQ